MGQALYRKYRSKTLDEVVGQEHVTKTIKNALNSGALSHAYLFTGPRGVGKTSVARILAHEINELEYDETKNYLDIIEIDAASNRRIDEIRDLRDKVHIAPASAKYKVYIIDEVHMLTKESFNALLKTLEEPPAHVIFILATTEAHKLPDTIISRTQHFNFKPIDEKLNTEHLLRIAKKESIELDPEAAALIAKHGSGSFRDSISLLDQLGSASSEVISVKDVQRALGIAPNELLTRILVAIDKVNAAELLGVLAEAQIAGYNAAQVATQLSARVRDNLVKSTDEQPGTFKLLKQLVTIPASDEPNTLLEIVLLEALFANTKPQDDTSQTVQKTVYHEVESSRVPAEEPIDVPVEKTIPQPIKDKTASAENEQDPWLQVLASLKSKHNTLYSIARMAECEIENSQVSLKFNFPFHYKRIIEPKNKSILETTIHTVLGKDYKLVCALGSNKSKTNNDTEETDIKAISNIFGDVEVLES